MLQALQLDESTHDYYSTDPQREYESTGVPVEEKAISWQWHRMMYMRLLHAELRFLMQNI